MISSKTVSVIDSNAVKCNTTCVNTSIHYLDDVCNLSVGVLQSFSLQQLSARQCLKESTNYEELSLEQVLEEKTAMQKALLYLESLHGRPSAKEERDLVRPLYDKYRTLKRLISKAGVSTRIFELVCS